MKTHGFRNQFRDRKRRVWSRTPGRQKAPCQINFMDRFFAKRSRSYKHHGYQEWYAKTLQKVYGDKVI